MTRRLFNPFLLLLARLTDPELARAVQFLKVENAMLRSRLPKRINLTPRERDRLFELGESLGVAVADLLSGSGGSVVGIDASQGMIETALEKARDGMQFVLMDINDLDFVERFDVGDRPGTQN